MTKTRQSQNPGLALVTKPPEDHTAHGPVAATPSQPTRSDPTMMELLQAANDLDITGVVTVLIEEIWDLSAWVRMLADPQILAWRETDTGQRYVQVTAQHRYPPVRGTIVLCWRGRAQHPLWMALLGNEDMKPGQERVIEPSDLLASLAQMRLTQSSTTSHP